MTGLYKSYSQTFQPRKPYFSSVDLTKNSGINRHRNDIREKLASNMSDHRKVSKVVLGLSLLIITLGVIIGMGL